jgi:lipopolysaccharide/colanic/teichoic acid biosynthesis glycosyltransferase
MLKRGFDLIAALVGLVISSPLMLTVALLIKIDSPGSVFFRGERVGKNGELFRILKFRTMVANAAQLGPSITSASDPRITRVGRWLRRTKTDELPQLWNVLAGDMSLVGPRPEDPHYVALYTSEQRQVLNMRPGITSPASLVYRNEERMLADPEWEKVYLTQVLPAKLAIDLDYFSQRTLLSDIVLILRTILTVH